jgi:hypothetical protein
LGNDGSKYSRIEAKPVAKKLAVTRRVVVSHRHFAPGVAEGRLFYFIFNLAGTFQVLVIVVFKDSFP